MYSLKALGGKRLGDVEESGSKVSRQPVINSGWKRDVFSHLNNTSQGTPINYIYSDVLPCSVWYVGIVCELECSNYNQPKNRVLSQCTYIEDV